MFGETISKIKAHSTLLLQAVLATAFILVVSQTSTLAQQNVAAVPQTSPSFIPSAQDIQAADGAAEIFGALSLTTDNRSQGFTSSNQENAVQFDVGIIWKNFYGGASASSIDFGQTTLADGSLAGIADLELTYYAGYVNVIKKFDYDVGVSYSTFPGARDAAAELNYWEFTAGIGREFGEHMRGGPARIGFRTNYAADYSGDSGDNYIFEGTFKKGLGKYRDDKIVPVLTANLGYQDGDENRGNIDYWFWSAGVEVKFHDKISLDMRYHDAADVPFNCADLCDAAFVGMLSYEFSFNLGGRKKAKAYK